MIKFRCAHCSKLLGGEDKQAGKIVTCPRCKGKTRIPMPGEAPPPKAPVKKLDKLDVVEEEEFEIIEEVEDIPEVDLAEFEAEEERPRKKPRPPEDEDE